MTISGQSENPPKAQAVSDSVARLSGAADAATQATDKLDKAAEDATKGARDLKGAAQSARILAERTFLNYQSQLRVGGTQILNEAMLVLDIIDTKTTSLLQYISISLAVMIFLWGIVLDPKLIALGPVGRVGVDVVLVLIIILLLTSIVICLSCLNIVGAHTIRNMTANEYEDKIIKVTNSRRNRYRMAHKLSLLTAVLSLLVFVMLATLGAHRLSDLLGPGPSRLLPASPANDAPG